MIEEAGKKKRDKKRLFDRIMILIIIISLIAFALTYIKEDGDRYHFDTRILEIEDMDNDGDQDFVLEGPTIYLHEDGGYSKVRKNVVGGHVEEFLIGDMNSDGYPDIIVYFESTNSIKIYFNDGACNFNADTAGLELTGKFSAVSVLDWDLDGHLDIKTAQKVLLNDGSGDFNESESYTGDLIYFHDMNADGLDDRIHITADTISIYEQGPGNVFQMQNHTIISDEDLRLGRDYYAEMLDLHRDGDLDIQLEDELVFVNNGNLTFTAVVLYELEYDIIDTSYNVRDVIRFYDDLNNDGLLDQMAIMSGTWDGEEVFYVALGDEDFKFGEPRTYSMGAYPSYYLEDLDDDGDLDVIASNFHSESITVRLNDGKGGLKKRTDYSLKTMGNFWGNDPSEMYFGDIDRDGDKDIIVGNYNGRSFSVLKNDGDTNFNDINEYRFTTLDLPSIKLVDDLDGDGFDDVLIKGSGPPGSDESNYWVFYNDGNGNFYTIYHYLRILFGILFVVFLVVFISIKIRARLKARKIKKQEEKVAVRPELIEVINLDISGPEVKKSSVEYRTAGDEKKKRAIRVAISAQVILAVILVMILIFSMIPEPDYYYEEPDDTHYGYLVDERIKPDKSYILDNEPGIELCDIDSDGVDEIVTMGQAVGFYDYRDGKYQWTRLPDNLSGDKLSEAAALDLTGDGINELVYCGYMDSEKGLFIFTIASGSAQLYKKFSIENYQWMAIFDVDHDGRLELAGMNRSYQTEDLFIIDELGPGSISKPIQVSEYTRYYLIDLEGDSDLKMIHSDFYSGSDIVVYNISTSGALDRIFEGDLDWNYDDDYAAVGEFDDIPGQEFVIAAYTGAVVCFGYEDGSYVKKWILEYNTPCRSDVEIGDPDNDGVKEIVLANTNTVGVLSIETVEFRNGEFTDGPDSPYYQWHFDAIELGDINGDGKNEIVALRSGIVEIDLLRTDGKISEEESILSISPNSLQFWVIILLVMVVISTVFSVYMKRKYEKKTNQ